MYKIEGKIKGVAPLLFNRMLDNELEPAKLKPNQRGRMSMDDRIVEAEQRCHKNSSGLYLPGWNLKQCVLEGCRRAGLKIGRRSMAPDLAACMFPDRELYFGKQEPDFMFTHWGRRPPRTGGACMISRPALKEGWELPFGLNVLDDRIDEVAIRRAMDEAGLLVGLGSWRPEFGRFLVVEWKT